MLSTAEITYINSRSVDVQWRRTLLRIFTRGHLSRPRGMLTREVLGHHVRINMRAPVLCCATRKLNYQFMAAEALWICTGDNRVESLTPYNSRMRQYSDDGLTLAGAYGPPIRAQLPYITETLTQDPESRQAALTIWQPTPAPSKDIPCTLTMVFQLRPHPFPYRGERLQLHTHVTMRASDAWLGFPYDVFSFSMVSMLVCTQLNERRAANQAVEPGMLYLTMASSHLYESTWDDALQCVHVPLRAQGVVPETVYTQGEATLLATLGTLRTISTSDHPLRWWTHHQEEE